MLKGSLDGVPRSVVGWSAVLVAVLLVQLPRYTAKAAEQCTLEVTEDMMRPLLPAPSPSWRCADLWSNLLLHFHYARKNLTECERREETVGTTPEPSYAFCQLMLDRVRDQLEDGRRTHARDMAVRVEIAQQELGKQQREQQAMEQELRKIDDEWRPLYGELLLTNIGMGHVKQALKYYHLHLEGHSPDAALYRTILQWVYRDARRQNERLDSLLTFVRHLPGGRDPKLAFYRLIKTEIRNRPEQRDGYLAAVAGLDAGRIVLNDDNPREYHLYSDLYDPVEVRWKGQVLAGNYKEVVAFANSHPMQYGEVETSFCTFKPDEWKRLNLNQFITGFPNALPLPKQRLEALLMILMQLKERNQKNAGDYLVRMAKEVDVCEAFVRKSKDSDRVQDQLAKVKRTFAEFGDGKHDYEYYLQESKKVGGGSKA